MCVGTYTWVYIYVCVCVCIMHLDCWYTVSYTHLDVYKRQQLECGGITARGAKHLRIVEANDLF